MPARSRPDDTGFGTALAVYRQKIVEDYGKLAAAQGHADELGAWFKALRPKIESESVLSEDAKAASITLLAEYENYPECLAGLGALYRWEGRSAVPLLSYIQNWEAACNRLRVSPALPVRVRELLEPF